MIVRVRLFRDLRDWTGNLRSGAVAIGNFDGVHRGHARIVDRLKAQATALGGPAIVFTFDPHPVRLLRPTLAPPPLTWTERKAELLAQLGVDAILAYPTDEALLRLSPQEFFDRIVREQLDARALVEGPNFCFGRDRTGNIDVLRRMCDASGLRLEVVAPLVEGDTLISSSRVRQLIADGDVRRAGSLLTSPYRIRGMVTHGARRGGKIGFPTANLNAIDTLLPRQGVYAGRGIVGTEHWPAAINIGSNPTFGEEGLKVEVHLIGFNRSIYGEPLEVDFLDRLRDIQPFPSVDTLVDQLVRDVQSARTIADRETHRS